MTSDIPAEPTDIEALLEQRGTVYGDAREFHTKLAKIWSVLARSELSATDAALMMQGLKILRASVGPSHMDSFDDALGYGTIARDIAQAVLDEEVKAEEPTDDAGPTHTFTSTCTGCNRAVCRRALVMPSEVELGVRFWCGNCGKGVYAEFRRVADTERWVQV